MKAVCGNCRFRYVPGDDNSDECRRYPPDHKGRHSLVASNTYCGEFLAHDVNHENIKAQDISDAALRLSKIWNAGHGYADLVSIVEEYLKNGDDAFPKHEVADIRRALRWDPPFSAEDL